MMQQILNCCFLLLFLASCKSSETAKEEETMAAKTPVTVTAISNESMQEYVELNATSSFLQKWIVRANATGYLQSANVQLNQFVSNGQLLYTVKTKEAQSIGNVINLLDSSFNFTGVNGVRANGSGFIAQVSHQNGDYVQDGDQLAMITDTKSFVFLLDLPYELRPYMRNKKKLELLLPDGEKVSGVISGNMPTMDAASQTQSIILKVNAGHALPENLIAKVILVKSFRGNAISLPKAAILADETQSEFWVMKLLNDSTAAKVPIKKGMETTERIEIIAPIFGAADRILVTGNYGLSDTARVQIVKE